MPDVNAPMMVIRKRLSATEGAPLNARINPDTGEYQVSPDGGITWVDDPLGDPRSNPAYIQPAPDVPDLKCAAAAGLVVAVDQYTTSLLSAFNIIGITTGSIALAGIWIPAIGWAYQLFLGVAGIVLGATSEAIVSAMTDENLETLRCIAYCHMDEGEDHDQGKQPQELR